MKISCLFLVYRYCDQEEQFRYNHFKLMDFSPSSLPNTYPPNLNVNNDKKSMHLGTASSRSSSERPIEFTYTEEAVSLLSQHIQRRISWDHERWLFHTQNQEQPLSQSLANRKWEEMERNKQLDEENISQKFYIFHQVKTPDMMGEFDQKQLQDFDLEIKNQGEKIITKKWFCSCQKSKCLKMYCQCFRNGQVCGDCGCTDCKNKPQDEKERKVAIEVIREKQPMAFINAFQYKGCKCTKSNCQKGYCDCFANGLMCGKYCKCIECKNCTKSKQVNRKLSRQAEIKKRSK